MWHRVDWYVGTEVKEERTVSLSLFGLVREEQMALKLKYAIPKRWNLRRHV